MIIVTRLHGASVAVSCDLIERVEAAPDTVLTVIDGSRHVVRESVAEIVEKVRAFCAQPRPRQLARRAARIITVDPKSRES